MCVGVYVRACVRVCMRALARFLFYLFTVVVIVIYFAFFHGVTLSRRGLHRTVESEVIILLLY